MIDYYFLLLLATASFTAKLPNSFLKCNRKEINFKTCVVKAAQDGIPKADILTQEFNLAKVTPFQISKFTIGEGKGVVAVEQKFQNCEVYGLTQLKIDKFEFDFDKKTLKIIGTFPEIRTACQYEFDGKVLFLPIQGQGASNIILKNLYVNVLFHFEEVEKNKKHYMKFTNTDLKLQPGFISFDFSNLFNGNKILSDSILKVLNDNWKEVFEDVEDGYVKFISEILLNIFNSLCEKLSMEEIFD